MKTIINFLKQLEQNNNKEWFHENKKLFDQAKQRFEDCVNILIPKIKEIDREVDVQSAKECIFRIYRDVRFSKNKLPYKTNFGAYIAKGGRKTQYAGYYLHIETNNASFAGGGIYCPPLDVLKAVRTEIYENPDEFKAIIYQKDFAKVFTKIYGEKLKTAPRGFPKDFPDINLLRYKSYTVIKNINDETVMSEKFFDNITDIFRTQYTFNKYLNNIIDRLNA